MPLPVRHHVGRDIHHRMEHGSSVADDRACGQVHIHRIAVHGERFQDTLERLHSEIRPAALLRTETQRHVALGRVELHRWEEHYRAIGIRL